MYACRVPRRLAPSIFVLVTLAVATNAGAQAPADPGQHQHEGHVMTHGDQPIPMTRDGSGTSWLPDETPMYAVHTMAKGWTLMGHGNVFLQYLPRRGDRGGSQTGSINWMMGMAQRPVGAARLTFRGMVSFEPATIGGCGYPDLLATGESCAGEAIHDRQHPHDLFMELAALYDRPIAKSVRLQLYGGPVGEPALGPCGVHAPCVRCPEPARADVASLVRCHAHHLRRGHGWALWPALEGRGFGLQRTRARRARTDFDLASMDSWSGRAWWLPTPKWAVQFSGGRLNDAEPGHESVLRWTSIGSRPRSPYHHTTPATRRLGEYDRLGPQR
jgi:hypothetical protein